MSCSEASGSESALRLASQGCLAVIGGGCSATATGAASVLSRFGIPLMGFSATSTELNDREKYPTFRRACHVREDFFSLSLKATGSIVCPQKQLVL